ncbi:EF-hand domain-containing protein [Luteimonas fraxinea]|uniref:EF-hand domain-containing protein n=1 Tax=Luteimonas fraxinea TaxID=2901869 RepID=A0ABS8UI34_9GAMM|nr:EF-hand domain-containing protein [Luteimonas fraxinea]MCD9098328.1 EF-hand domain-containing protein [Luteimonas fraxinea]MCD9127060.1 EF-hand domain-containing protein [Luteimonas fraxinea]UHH08738.1 EF-hand domain-containing protein [Luteimonas fraxinea]
MIRTSFAVGLLALATALPAVAQVTTSPLQQADAQPSVSSQSGRQTGVVTMDRDDGRQVIVRSYEPRSAQADQYRVDFAALDVDGDGYISRVEAKAHPALDAEFNAIDSNRDGRLSREELAGWLR